MRKLFLSGAFILAFTNLAMSAAPSNDFFGLVLSTNTEPIQFSASANKLPLIIDKTQWNGFRSGIIQPGEVVFRDATEWDQFWQAAMAPYEKKFRKTPAVDFSKEMVIGVFGGENSYAADEIDITAIKEKSGELVVHFTKTEFMIGMATPRVIVQPYHLKKTTVFSGQIRFVQD